MRYFASLVTGVLASVAALIVQVLALMFFFNASEKEIITTFSATHVLSFTLFLPVAALIEEACKYVMIVARGKFFQTRRAIVLHAMLIGIGFFVVEYSLLLIGESAAVSVFSVGKIFLLHAFTATLMGVLITIIRTRVLFSFLSIILLSTIIHALYNMTLLFSPVIASSLVFFLLSAMILLVLFAFLRDRVLAQTEEMPYNESA